VRFIICVVAFSLVVPLHAAKKTGKNTGVLCVAAFRTPPMGHGPNMSETTWAPRAGSKFEFRVGKNIKAIVPAGQMVKISGVPADRKVMVGVRLDGKPFESFPLDLREEEGRRACLWLREGYWHWTNSGWSKAHGCRCGG
jgi:hypothetical protein